MTLDPGRIVSESTPTVRVRGHLWCGARQSLLKLTGGDVGPIYRMQATNDNMINRKTADSSRFGVNLSCCCSAPAVILNALFPSFVCSCLWLLIAPHKGGLIYRRSFLV